MYTQPDIWRTVLVPSDIPLDRFHDVLQITMGWQDAHLHMFTIGKKRYTEKPEPGDDTLAEHEYRLGDLVKKVGESCTYWYDFGDDWMHRVELVQILKPEEKPDAPLWCTDGAGACPPEDVGGPPGYQHMCEAVLDPKHEEHEEVLEWLGIEDWDADFLSLDMINLNLISYLRWSRPRSLDWPWTF